MKRRAGLLKRVCRQRTQAAWKEWRHSMEAQRHASLSSHLQQLHQDHAALAQGQQQVRHLQTQAHQLGQRLRADKAALKARREVRCKSALTLHKAYRPGSRHGSRHITCRAKLSSWARGSELTKRLSRLGAT